MERNVRCSYGTQNDPLNHLSPLPPGAIRASQSGDTSSMAPATSSTNPPVKDWTEDDVQQWLKNAKLEELCDTLDSFEGCHLEKLYSEYCRDPKEFKDDMRCDYQMNAKTCLKFSVALEKLFHK